MHFLICLHVVAAAFYKKYPVCAARAQKRSLWVTVGI
jgi:hypothetical protein